MERLFLDRIDAGQRLAEQLTPYKDQECVVLALPRGGVPVAVEIARKLSAPMDLVLVRKIGAPGAPEFGIGAVVDGKDRPQVILNPGIGQMNIPEGYVEAEVARLLAEIEQRRRVYHQPQTQSSLQGKIAILVDDGIATGVTIRAALQALRRRSPAAIILAIPVAPPALVRQLSAEVDDLVCLLQPIAFTAVGQFYQYFDQLSDSEVIAGLQEARSFPSHRGTID